MPESVENAKLQRHSPASEEYFSAKRGSGGAAPRCFLSFLPPRPPCLCLRARDKDGEGSRQLLTGSEAYAVRAKSEVRL